MTSSFDKFIKKLVYYEKITKMGEIGRRYFAMNALDVGLTILGVLIGSYIAGITNPVLVVSVGMGVTVAVGVSGLWGAYLTESAERKRELKELEASLHRKLDKTDIKKAQDFAVAAIAIINGASPLLASLFLLIPFFLITGISEANTLYSVNQAYFLSFGLSAILFFGLGAFLGKISKENIAMTGIKMLSAGVICMIILMLLGTAQI